MTAGMDIVCRYALGTSRVETRRWSQNRGLSADPMGTSVTRRGLEMRKGGRCDEAANGEVENQQSHAIVDIFQQYNGLSEKNRQ